MNRPMQEYFASYDIFHLIQRQRRCVELKATWLQCKQKAKEIEEADKCKEDLERWAKTCNMEDRIRPSSR